MSVRPKSIILGIAASCCMELSVCANVELITDPYSTTLLENHQFAIGKFSYKGEYLCGSNGYNGSVLAPENGKFIGIGHTEGGREILQSIKLEVDGREMEKITGKITGKAIKLTRVLRQDKIQLTNIVAMTSDGITTTVQYTAMAEQKVATYYINQYCFSELTDSWLIGRQTGDYSSGIFLSNEKFIHFGFIKWLAVYNSKTRKGLVCVLNAAATAEGTCRIWDRANYHKLYHQLTLPAVIPAGEKSEELIIKFRGFDAEPNVWKPDATKLADGMSK